MNSGEQFDKMVKSILENGVEEVPAGVWEKIVSGMAADGGPVRSGWKLWWKRALAGVAFACIAAGVIVLVKPGKPGEPGSAIASTATEASGSGTAEERGCNTAAVPAETIFAEAAAGEAETSAPEAATRPAGRASQKAAAGEAETTVPEVAAGTVAQTAAVEATAETSVSEAASEATAETTAVEMATVIAAETVRRNRLRLSLDAGGNAAKNAGGHSYGYGRFATSRMDFGTDGCITETEATNYTVPIAAGIGIRFNFNSRWALGIGLNYTYLNRHFKGVYDYGGIENFQCDDVNNDQHFIGLPVNAYFTILSSDRIRFYAYAGGAVEKCISNRYRFDYYRQNVSLRQNVQGIQASVDAGIGLQVNITGNFGIYLDPSFRYYFKNYLQPKSIRTIQPFQIGAELGLRWDL